ncbi:MAG: hypothetical protein D6706_01535 [Chloroflexi bacterium]|nr:MAG: hypothetical protein D6706_01535 [Chloroflexota bacterium]
MGAVGAIIFNHSTGGNTWVTMGGDPVNIPAAFITHDDGLNLVPADGQTVVVSAADDVQSLPDPYTPADKIADFSSRGPRGTDSMLKPDITAPGVAIFAAAMGEGVNGVSFSGTSMAAPHVAGVAALMRQAHPNWTVEQIKAAMMNTAVDLTDNSPVPRQGAGRVDAYKAVTADTVAIGDKDLVSLNWGVVPFSTDFYYDTKLITLRNFTSTAKVYTATWYFYTESMTKGVSLSLPVTVSVSANGSASVPVNLTIDATQVPNEFERTLEEYSGYVVFTNTVVPTDSLRVPFYLQPRPYSQVSDDGTSVTSFPYTSFGWLSLEHTGPISSSLFIYPVYVADTNELDVLDHGDIRYIGMDYGWNNSTYGDIFVPAISSYGAWHTPQPYISEFDMYLDVDEDGTYDLLNFNWNYGAYNGGDSDDVWVIVQVDLQTSDLSLGSPYLIYTDYNASFQEWYLPATWNGLEDITTTANTDFNYQFFGFDVLGNSDASEAGYFDIAKRPFVYLASDDPGPDNRSAAWVPIVNDTGGYLATRPKGVMVVDYNGHPDNQVLYFPLDVTGFTNIFMPLISQQ